MQIPPPPSPSPRGPKKGQIRPQRGVRKIKGVSLGVVISRHTQSSPTNQPPSKRREMLSRVLPPSLSSPYQFILFFIHWETLPKQTLPSQGTFTLNRSFLSLDLIWVS